MCIIDDGFSYITGKKTREESTRKRHRKRGDMKIHR